MFFGAWALAAVIAAQDFKPRLDSLAIVGARIETRPGQVLEKGTVLCQNGKIIAVGPTLVLPAGTETIDGTGLTVYYGFVDFGVTKGLKEPEASPRQAEPFEPNEDVATSMAIWSPALHADWRGADLYNPDDAFWKSERVAGFTTAVIYPGGGVVKGQASVVNLDGRARSSSVLKRSAALFIGLDGLGGSYPGTVLGVFASIRQTFLDATWWEQSQSDYEKGSGPRPVDDPNLTALTELKDKGMPVILEANESWKIESALSLAKELEMKPIVFGAREAHRVQPELTTVVRVDFATEPTAETDKDEPAAKHAERKRLWSERVSNAVGEAYTTQGCKDQDTFFANLRQVVKAGVPRERVLRALNQSPYELVGLQKMFGEVAPGFVANLTVLSADFVDSSAKVKFLIIDGRKVDPNKDPFKFSNPAQGFGDGR